MWSTVVGSIRMGCSSSKDTDAELDVLLGMGHTCRIPKLQLPKELAETQGKKYKKHALDERLFKSGMKMIETLPELDKGGNLTAEEVLKRISGSKSSISVNICDRDIRYAVLTKKGFYPNDFLKPNQDSYAIKHDIGGKSKTSYFGVYDGHGDDGHGCSDFVRKNLPHEIDVLSRQLQVKAAKVECEANGTMYVFNAKNLPTLTKEQCENICHTSYCDTDKGMKEDKDVSTKLSGSTAVSAIFHQKLLTVCNTGDSRAVLASINPKVMSVEANLHDCDLVAVPLTRDQTPYRKDELDRVRNAGARVLTIEQISKNLPAPEGWEEKEINYDGDIPRVWIQTKAIPGAAFTRSLGDEVGEKVGMIATPEIITREITSRDRILILASDGIFEFLTNQQVIDISKKHKDPLDACKDILKQSYKMWLEYESSVDDMTVLVIFLE